MAEFSEEIKRKYRVGNYDGGMLDGVEQVLHIAKAAPLISILFIAIMLALFDMLCFVMFRVPSDPLPGSTQPTVAESIP